MPGAQVVSDMDSSGMVSVSNEPSNKAADDKANSAADSAAKLANNNADKLANNNAAKLATNAAHKAKNIAIKHPTTPRSGATMWGADGSETP